MDKQITHAPHGHILTNIGCWSADGQWLVFDTRSDAAGSQFDGRSIQRVHVQSGRVEQLYMSQRGANVGVVTCCPISERMVFIHGPEEPSVDWPYAAYHRRGVVLTPGQADPMALDAMCYHPPLVDGALRGGSHVHTFDPQGKRVAFTYEDHLLATVDRSVHPTAERNQRNIGLSTPGRPVHVPKSHPRNHDGHYFSVLGTHSVDQPQPGSDQVDRAYEDAWLGPEGRSLAFLGDVVSSSGGRLTELFVLELPDDLTQPGDLGPLAGTPTTRPRPPRGCIQRRLTYTQDYPYPGIAGPRHWPRSTPDGSLIFFLMRDEHRQAQLWCIASDGTTAPRQVTRTSGGVTSAFSVSDDGQHVAYIAQGCVCVTSIDGQTTRVLTEPTSEARSPRPEACVFAPDSRQIAYVRHIDGWNQLCVCGGN